MSNGGNVSWLQPKSAVVVTDLRRGKTDAQLQLKKRRVRMCERNISADSSVSGEGGGGGAP